ncbi:MAG: nucleoside hydrolase [Erysipelotrichaceae bacterium]
MVKEKIIMDVDPGIDDSLAILLACAAENLDVQALTIVSGNIEVNQAAKNGIKALAMAKRDDVPVYKGASLPLEKVYTDATDTHGLDGVGENYYEVEDRCETQDAIDYYCETLRAHPHELTILALGPLTTMAKVIERDPEALSFAKQIIIMGGAAKIHGNCSPVAEYNFWVDPHAAKIFFEAGYPNVTLIPLDVTYRTILSPNMREMIRQLNCEVGNYINEITRFYVDFHWAQERTLGCVINDPLVVAYLMDPSVVKTKPATVSIETEGIAVGQSLIDFTMKFGTAVPVQIGMEVDHQKFFDLFFKNIFKEHVADIELMFQKQFI